MGPAGFVTGIEIAHPDKGVEMMLYELGVDDAYRRRGIGRALVEELEALARETGCAGMWVPVEHGNDMAIALYRACGADEPEPRPHSGGISPSSSRPAWSVPRRRDSQYSWSAIDICCCYYTQRMSSFS